ncbi:uncharacterized protein LOC117335367 [Pecten maximus]|uniref:uncharacterized protein LOC117335367 n=1 Tax=Pecten maximus TaxID=6579 RepID=UPI001457EFBE|nr:uncharacterized protein LOC117335367 [Pecten maximus]
MKSKESTKKLSIFIFNPNPVNTEPATVVARGHNDMSYYVELIVSAMSGYTLIVPGKFEVTEAGTHRKGIFISSSQNLIITGNNRADQGTYSYTDSFHALPEDSLGTSYYAVTANDRAEILIVAGYDDTDVTITVNGIIRHKGKSYSTGQSFTETLEEFDTLLVQAADSGSLTGTHISSDIVVSVYSGNEYTAIGMSNHLVQQLAPVQTWSDFYMLIPPLSTEFDVIIVAVYPGTEVNVTCDVPIAQSQITLNEAGSSVSRDMTDRKCYVEASKHVSVTMLVRSSRFDPAMIRIQPTIVFQSTQIRMFISKPTDFTTVIVLFSTTKGNVLLDNEPVSFTSILEYYYARIGISTGSHKLSCRFGDCMLSAYIHGYHNNEAMGAPIVFRKLSTEEQTTPTPLSTGEQSSPTHQSTGEPSTPTHQSTGEPSTPTHQSTGEPSTPTHQSTREQSTLTHQSTREQSTPTHQSTGEPSTPTHQSTREESTPTHHQLSTEPTYDISSYTTTLLRRITTLQGEYTNMSVQTVTTQMPKKTTKTLNQTCECYGYSCQQSNYSQEQLENLVAELKQELLVAKRATSNHKRTLVCARDHRTSAKVAGYMAGTVLVILAVGMLIVDIPNLWGMLKTIKRNLCNRTP